MSRLVQLLWSGFVMVVFLCGRGNAQSESTDNENCLFHDDCKAKLCLKGVGSNKKCLSVATDSAVTFSPMAESNRWEIRHVSGDLFEISTTQEDAKKCLLDQHNENNAAGGLRLGSCDQPTLWTFNKDEEFVGNNVWQIKSAQSAVCISAKTPDGSVLTENNFDSDLQGSLQTCLALNGPGAEDTLLPQLFVFKGATLASPLPTRSPVTLDDTVGRVCLKAYPHLCLGLSLPSGKVEDGLPIQIKHFLKNDEKNLTLLKLEWHMESLSRRFREERIAPFSKEDSCVAVSDENRRGEMLLLPCNDSDVQAWALTLRGFDGKTVSLVNERTGKCATVIKCAAKENGCPRSQTAVACESTRVKAECNHIKPGAFVRLRDCENVIAQEFTYIVDDPSVETTSIPTQDPTASVPTTTGQTASPSSSSPTSSPTIPQSVPPPPPPPADNSAGLLTAVLVLLLLGAAIFAYCKIRKSRFTELKGGEDDFGDNLGSGGTNNFVDEPLHRSNDVEIVKIS